MINTRVYDELKQLAHLQLIDFKLYRLRQLRGTLPKEIEETKDRVEGISYKIELLHHEINQLQKEERNHQKNIEEKKILLKKYQEQLSNVRNEKEYETLSSEIELTELDIQASERKISDLRKKIELKNQELSIHQKELEEYKSLLEEKEKELESILKETQEEEEKYQKKREEVVKTIKERIYRSYERIRQKVLDGRVVVVVERNACGGCHALLPPQRLYEITLKDRRIICESCGRIIVDRSLFEEIDPAFVQEYLVTEE
jgi:predicted  nucleic acid-binding Zn-ribbon protein